MIPATRRNWLLLLSSFHVFFISALSQNVTVDDAAMTGSVPQYFPAPTWTQGADCPGCGAQPDPQQAFNGTWHDTTFTPSDGIARAIEFDFSGNAIYVFFILANTIQFVDTTTEMNFLIDEEVVGTFQHNASESTDFQYNVPVYVNESLPSGQHHIRMEATGNRSSLILFDYLIYTANSNPSTTIATAVSTVSDGQIATTLVIVTPSSGRLQGSTKTNIGAIVGGTIAGLAVLFSLLGLLICYRRRRTAANRGPPRDVSYGGAPPSMSANATVGITPFAVPPTNTESAFRHPEQSENVRKLLGSKATGSTALPAIAPSELRPASVIIRSASTSLPTIERPTDDTAMLRGQVEFLIDEVARLRHVQNHLGDAHSSETESQAPPGYSEIRTSPVPVP